VVEQPGGGVPVRHEGVGRVAAQSECTAAWTSHGEAGSGVQDHVWPQSLTWLFGSAWGPTATASYLRCSAGVARTDRDRYTSVSQPAKRRAKVPPRRPP